MTSLPDYEMKLVTDANVIVAKNKIIAKVYDLFGDLAEAYTNTLAASSLHIATPNPKISRGESYKGLPYVILDYPRSFAKNEVFAIRSFFWWGNFFSISLHLSGEHLQRFSNAIESAIGNHNFTGWHISTASEWEHHFDSDNFQPMDAHTLLKLSELSFVRFAKKIPLSEWERANDFFSENFRQLIYMLHQAPMR